MHTNIHIPYFKYFSKDPAHRHLGFIEIEKDVIYWIDDLDDFYQAFGYSKDMRSWGVMPDDFMWEKYFCAPEGEHCSCFQMHLIEYLLTHSSAFVNKFGNRCDDWIAAYKDELCDKTHELQ